MNDDAQHVLDVSAVDQIELLRSGSLTVTAITEAALARAQTLQPKLNAFLEIDHRGALARAAALDVLPHSVRQAMPLFGLPVAHKDVFDRAGRITTGASRVHGNTPAASTAPAVRALDEAGAINIGTLNLSEFASNPYGINTLIGAAKNPWDAARCPGGSSSGSAVAVASRIIGASLGSDTGGSIRIPAACCGVFGLLPTYGLITCDGVLPLSPSFDTVGPLGRSARDIARLMLALTGTDYETGLGQGVQGLRIAVPLNHYSEVCDSETIAALGEARDVLTSLGAEIVPVEIPDPRAFDSLGNTIIVFEASQYHRRNIEEHGD
jgi:aspartyl-tRNA(Asn)/glutamyl-tRNA(Gln) amidotransferase subunit A